MIRAVCLNPVVDRLYYIDDFSAGTQYKEIKPDIYAGGKGVNIARVVSQLGEKCELYAFLGGSAGRVIESDMEKHGVTLHPFRHEGETRTTVNIIDNRQRLETEITEPGVTVGKALVDSFFEELASDLSPDDIVVCSGIPLKGMDVGIYKEISNLCADKKASCFLDVNSIYLKAAFPARYSFFKPNINELRALFDDNKSPADVLMRKAVSFGVVFVMVSTGKDGCLFMSDDEYFSVSVPDEKVVSTIGSGDSSVAGFAVAKARGLDNQEAARLAMAAGVSNATHREVGFIDRSQVEDLFKHIAILNQEHNQQGT